VTPLFDAIRIVRPYGTIVLVGLKTTPVPGFPIDEVTLEGITLLGSMGTTDAAYRRAADLVADGSLPVAKMRTHVFGLHALESAIAVLRGADPSEFAINVVITPTTSGHAGAR
jgi:threonine dehydrogenase-like Zn-dependent dehydrogenase